MLYAKIIKAEAEKKKALLSSFLSFTAFQLGGGGAVPLATPTVTVVLSNDTSVLRSNGISIREGCPPPPPPPRLRFW